MKHLKKFETFLVPKSVRNLNPKWKDEDIAIEILEELKSLKGNSEDIAKLSISGDFRYEFTINGFKFEVSPSFRAMLPNDGELKMNGNKLKVSSEVCNQIVKTIEELKNTENTEMKEDDKKDFRISRGLM